MDCTRGVRYTVVRDEGIEELVQEEDIYMDCSSQLQNHFKPKSSYS